MARRTNTVNRRVGRWLAACGAIYMCGSLLRIVVGLTITDAPTWFSVWISVVFHLVLAGFVFTVAHFHFHLRARSSS
jgi:hypothetical protein